MLHLVSACSETTIIALHDQPERRLKREVVVGGQRIVLDFEVGLWGVLGDICMRERISIHKLCADVARSKAPEASLATAIRIFALAYARALAQQVQYPVKPPASSAMSGVVLAYRRPG